MEKITKSTSRKGFTKKPSQSKIQKKIFIILSTILSRIFMIQKNVRLFFLCSVHDQLQLVNESLTFKKNANEIYEVELSEVAKSIKKTLQWKRENFKFRSLYCDLNAFVLSFSTGIYMSRDGYIQICRYKTIQRMQ